MSFLEKYKTKKLSQNGELVQMETPSRNYGTLPPINGNFSLETNQYIEDLKSGQSNILVAVRVRPLNSREIAFSNYETVKVLDGKVIVLLDPNNHFEANDVLRNNRNKEKQYAFDFAFDQHIDTETIFENTTKFLIPGVLNGFNATVFAYGPTGAGKTYTMLGNANKRGIMFETMRELFEQIRRNSTTKAYTVKVSYLEVYNETLRDLLSIENNVLDIREDNSKGAIIYGISETLVHTPEEVMSVLSVGSKNRIMESTGANVVSSRSHAVLQVTVEHREKNSGVTDDVTSSKLCLIDLAGSERAANTQNTGQRMIEGANINKSLLALGNCITLLSSSHEKGKNIHIPYRDSKLTRLLKDSLGGNCRTVMIANLSPSVITFDDTRNTLEYANRAKRIKTNVQRNVLKVENHVEKYAQIISDLKQENDQLKQLLQRQQSGGFIEPQAIRESSPNVKSAVVSEIKQHFDDEARLKRKIFDLDFLYDDVSEKLALLSSEMEHGEDKYSKSKYDEYMATQKKLALQVDEAQRDFNSSAAKRNLLQNKIGRDRNEDTKVYLMSIFKQNAMMIENMDLQHREKRIENQVKLKDRQLKALQNRLGVRERNHSMEPQVSVNHRNTHNDNILHDLENSIKTDFLSDSNSFLMGLNELEQGTTKSTNFSVITKAKQALHLPSINPKVNYTSPRYAAKRVLNPVKRMDVDGKQGNKGNRSSPKLSQQPDQQYYYNKQEFLENKFKPFEGSHSERSRKKRVGLRSLQDQVKREVLGGARRHSGGPKRQDNPTPERFNPKKVMVSGQIRHSSSAKSVNNLSNVSTASTNQHKDKKLILKELNKRAEPGVIISASTKAKAMGRQAAIMGRYGASPYVNDNTN